MVRKETALAANLKRLRKAHDLSQKRLSAISGVSFRSIQNAEAKLSDLGAESLAAIAQAMNTTIDDLVMIDGAKTQSPTMDSLYKIIRDLEAMLPKDAELRDLLPRATEADWDLIKDILDTRISAKARPDRVRRAPVVKRDKQGTG